MNWGMWFFLVNFPSKNVYFVLSKLRKEGFLYTYINLRKIGSGGDKNV